MSMFNSLCYGLYCAMCRNRTVSEEKVEDLRMKPGQMIIYYGCGPGRYIPSVSRLIGPQGKLYAADIQLQAISEVRKLCKKNNLENVEAVLVNNYSCPVENNSADIIYCFDVFHRIENPAALFTEFHRLIKKDGVLIMDEGHPGKESRTYLKQELLSSGKWEIISENKMHIRCRPKKFTG